MTNAPFSESRRLTGPNLYFSDTGAALETADVPSTEALAQWRANIDALRQHLGWADDSTVARVHATGASLAFAAPADQLYSAAAANEWAWCNALGVAVDDDESPLHGITEREQALAQLVQLAQAEARPAIAQLVQAAYAKGLQVFVDEDALTIGGGRGGKTWPLDALPRPESIDFGALQDIPTALVTGSNGKTTSTRLLAAIARANGWPCAWSSTEGVLFDGVQVDEGDYSGPGGARLALRQPNAAAAVLETARGGLLRRGLASSQVDAAIVTNVSPDHLGEYGIHDLDDLAEVKLIVARAVNERGLLVLNADDERLRRLGAGRAPRIGWFAADFDDAFLQDHRNAGGASAGVRNGQLLLGDGQNEFDLGAVAAMPSTLRGHARHNIANLSAAALAARAMGVPPEVIAEVAARFGSEPGDNPGRLQQWQFGKLRVMVDYAHNADGIDQSLRALLAEASADARLGITLGHAGNRLDEDYSKVAAVVASFEPTKVILKEVAVYERGRAVGEVTELFKQAFAQHGIDGDAVELADEEVQASQRLLQWASDGDFVFLQVLTVQGRQQIVGQLAQMMRDNWQPGSPLPTLSPVQAAT